MSIEHERLNALFASIASEETQQELHRLYVNDALVRRAIEVGISVGLAPAETLALALVVTAKERDRFQAAMTDALQRGVAITIPSVELEAGKEGG